MKKNDIEPQKAYRVKGISLNCGKINRVYHGNELFFHDNATLNGYLHCVSSVYRNIPRFRSAEDVTIEEIPTRTEESTKNKNTLAALRRLYERIGYTDVLTDIANDHVTENTCRNGRTVLWYMDESRSQAIYTDGLEFLTEEEIESELC